MVEEVKKFWRGPAQPLVVRTNEAVGIDWMQREELTQAIPPVYTEYIGRQLLAVVQQVQQ